MSESSIEHLTQTLEQLLGQPLPAQAGYNINAAMELAAILEARGFTFQLKDLCPKSMTETNWGATFLKDDAAFSAQSPQAPVAVCMAAVGALSP